MRQSIVVWIGGLLVLFAGVVIWKSRSPAEPAKDAVSSQTQAEKDDVRRFWAVYRQATAHRLAGRYREAIAAYEEALALNDRHEDALYYLGNMEMEVGRYEEARAQWENLVALNPKSARAHAQLGDLHLCFIDSPLFDLDAAEASFREALAINQEETGPVLRLGQVALVRGDLAAATARFEDVLGSNQGSMPAQFLQGYVAWKQGRTRAFADALAVMARHRQRATPRTLGLSEGDTKTGTTAMVSEAAGCPLFTTFLAGLDTLSAAALGEEVKQRYQRLGAQLARLQPRAGN